MMRRLVRAAVQSATVTSGEGLTLKLDPLILRAANILPLEQVEIVHHATGERIVTFAEAADEGSGAVIAPRLRSGDTISIIAWGTMHDGQTLNHTAKVVTVDGKNVVLAIREVAAVEEK